MVRADASFFAAIQPAIADAGVRFIENRVVLDDDLDWRLMTRNPFSTGAIRAALFLIGGILLAIAIGLSITPGHEEPTCNIWEIEPGSELPEGC